MRPSGRAKGIRLTGQRRLIAEVLSGAKDHPDVPELHRRVAVQSATIEQLQEEIAHRLGYEIVGHRLELYAVPRRRTRGGTPT
jgi:Fe2+ or Zn2+ uptake regulation protein